jgi:putative ABC transport system permease protein
LIQNTFRIIVAQRTHELATLRLVGASRAQVLRLVLVEAGMVGLVASGLGLILGVVLARVIRQLLAFGGSLPETPFQLAPRTILVAVATGLLITIVSALLPARGASRINPIAALRRVQLPDTPVTNRRRGILGATITLLGVLVLAAGLLDWELPVSNLVLVGSGAGLTFIGIAVLAAVFARPVTAAVGAPLAGVGVPGRLAVENAGRAPRRTAATASALMVGLALVSLTLVLADSLKTTADRLIGDRFEADLVVAPAGFGASRLSPQMAADLRALPEIEVLAAVRDGQVLYDDENRTLLGGPTAVLSDLVNFTLLDGEISDIAGNRIGMRSGLAEGLSIGDEVTIEFARTGAQRFQLAAIFDARGIGAGLLVDSSTFAANFTEQFDSQVFIDLADGITLVEGRTAVEAVTARYVGSQVLDQEELASEAGSRIDELVRLVFGLLGVAVVIALIGITNTLTLSVLERRREIGLLRAVGLSRRQLRTAIGWEAVLIALLGALLGLGLGLIFAWAVITALDDEVLRLSVPWVRVGLSLIAAALAGLIAAAVPAWRASRRNILEAISYE